MGPNCERRVLVALYIGVWVGLAIIEYCLQGTVYVKGQAPIEKQRAVERLVHALSVVDPQTTRPTRTLTVVPKANNKLEDMLDHMLRDKGKTSKGEELGEIAPPLKTGEHRY
jgi:hypothetical protein